ncbi:MAG: UbiA prenyltransferase family protein [Phycisphaerales bacterium]
MNTAPDQLADGSAPSRGAVLALNAPGALLRLARPHQWVKGAFVLIGPLYGFVFMREALWATVACVLAAFCAFAFASSACYIINDLKDIDADRAHPRKKRRPLASGEVTPRGAIALACGLGVLAAAAVGSIGLTGLPGANNAALWVGATVLLYSANVIAYSVYLKHKIIADVISLALGFVLRVLGGCASVWVQPSSWLLNVTLFAAMFLALGKRLGERRTMGEAVAQVRGVQALYTDTLLQMLVVVTGVATLMTYAGYVQAMGEKYHAGFNLLWLTILPATYGLLRCLVMLEKGVYDDPTELARKDRAFQLAGLVFVLITVTLMVAFRR